MIRYGLLVGVMLALTVACGCSKKVIAPTPTGTTAIAVRPLPTVTPAAVLALGQPGTLGVIRVTAQQVVYQPAKLAGTKQQATVTLRAENPTTSAPQPSVIAQIVCADGQVGSTQNYIEANNTFPLGQQIPPQKAVEGTLLVAVPDGCQPPVKLRVSTYGDPTKQGPDWAAPAP